MTKQNKLIPLIIVITILVAGSTAFYILFFGQTSTSQDKLEAATSQEKKEKKGSLLFFMDPSGRPCQQQDAIINSSKTEIETKARIFYLKTSNPADMAAFSQYGIRSLPALILLDEQGNEAKRFTPGIHSKKEILAALDNKTN